MPLRDLLTSFLLVILLNSCTDRSVSATRKDANEEVTDAFPSSEAVDTNFNDFIEKFSTDSTFQISRTIFPLKIKCYDMENDKDSLIYKDRSDFEMMDFRKKKFDTQYDKWEQKRVVDKNDAFAKIEIRGIDNGIIVDYLFEKTKGIWVLVEIDDDST